MSLPFHPYADLFPLIEGEEFAELVADLKANDMREKIVVWDGAILDGRNRYRAALAAGLLEEDDEPDRAKYFTRFVPAVDGNPLAFVISKNLKRRHLDESQRAMIGARLATMRQGERTDIEPSANLPKVDQPTAAKHLSISERALRHAKRVQDHGEPELIRAVDRGRLAVSVAERATHLSKDIQRQIAAEAEAGNANVARNVVKREARTVREADLAQEQRGLPSEKFGVILADPEWRFEPWSRATGLDRSPDNHYPTSCTEVIAQRDVPSIAAKDCVLFLWATAPMLPHALLVMAAWGFEYRSQVIWHKVRPTGHPFLGTGYWFRNAHEILLVGVKGDIPAPAMGTQEPSVIEAPIGAHSAKPECFLEMIEEYFPTLPKIELNRRGPARPGWAAWGNEAQPGEYDEHGEIIESQANAGDSTTVEATDVGEDPPYALTNNSGSRSPLPGQYTPIGKPKEPKGGFMGKKWDTGECAFSIDFWAEVLRVLKPGAHLVASGGTRTFHRMACAIEDAGFEIRDCCSWNFGSGFPKSRNVSKVLGDEEKRCTCDQNLRSLRNGVEAAHTLSGGAQQDVFASVQFRPDFAGEQGEDQSTSNAVRAVRHDDVQSPLQSRTECGGILQPVMSQQDVRGSPETICGEREGETAAGQGIEARAQPGLEGWGNLSQAPGQLRQREIRSLLARASVDGEGGRICDGASAGDGELDRSPDRLGSKHPTVKPLDLMQWLVRLVTPKGGLVLDPFAGTGTTGEAAWREGMRAVLIEREPEYQADIRRRMAHVLAGPDERRRTIAKARAPETADHGPLFGASV